MIDPSLLLVLSSVLSLAGAGLGFWLAKSLSAREKTRLEETHSLEKKGLEEKISDLVKDCEEKRLELEEKRETISKTQVRNAQLESQNEQLNQDLVPELREDKNQLKMKLDSSREELLKLEKEVSVLRTTLDEEREQNSEKLKILEEAKGQLKEQFENLANKILEQNSERFKTQSKENLNTILNPFKEKLMEFHKTVQDTHKEGSNDRLILKEELKRLKGLNERLSEDANNLTNALKGESKTRGIWGEMVLEKVLENSGLHKGREYETQVSVKDEDGSRYLPDVIVHLPEDKDLVIDSKVSLNAWERLCSAQTDQDRETQLKSHILSLKTHIKQLSDKSYEELESIRTLDYVLMFIPIETAFLSAMEHEPGLFDEAFQKRIVIVTPSTLMVTLRTIENIWRYERQNQNAQEIARQAGGLYDKLVGFVESMQEVGKSITRARTSWEKANSQLHEGKGNLVTRAEKMKALGVSTKKSLPTELLGDEKPKIAITNETTPTDQENPKELESDLE